MDIEYKFDYRYNPKSNRLDDYNYSENGGYFVTICCKDRVEYFGEIVEGEMILNDIGKEIKIYYLEIPNKYPYITIDELIIMPNHIHFVIFINNNDVINKDAINGHLYNGDNRGGFTGDKNCMIQKSLGKVINWFKGRCTFEINKKQDKIYFQWQKNYYDRIIRNDNELDRIRIYIKNNPLKWKLEKDNEQGIFM